VREGFVKVIEDGMGFTEVACLRQIFFYCALVLGQLWLDLEVYVLS
jgi:hypothetical protein